MRRDKRLVLSVWIAFLALSVTAFVSNMSR